GDARRRGSGAHAPVAGALTNLAGMGIVPAAGLPGGRRGGERRYHSGEVLSASSRAGAGQRRGGGALRAEPWPVGGTRDPALLRASAPRAVADAGLGGRGAGSQRRLWGGAWTGDHGVRHLDFLAPATSVPLLAECLSGRHGALGGALQHL